MSPGQLSGARVTIGGSREREGSKAGSISEILFVCFAAQSLYEALAGLKVTGLALNS